jgi:hypothetical protein
LWDAAEELVAGQGGLKPEMHSGGPVWRAKPKIVPRGLDLGGTREFPLQEGCGAKLVAEEGLIEGLGELEPDMRQGGRFGARHRISGSIWVGPVGSRWIMVVGCRGQQERGRLNVWGVWNPGCTRGAGFGARNRKSSAARSISVGPAGSASRR